MESAQEGGQMWHHITLTSYLDGVSHDSGVYKAISTIAIGLGAGNDRFRAVLRTADITLAQEWVAILKYACGFQRERETHRLLDIIAAGDSQRAGEHLRRTSRARRRRRRATARVRRSRRARPASAVPRMRPRRIPRVCRASGRSCRSQRAKRAVVEARSRALTRRARLARRRTHRQTMARPRSRPSPAMRTT